MWVVWEVPLEEGPVGVYDDEAAALAAAEAYEALDGGFGRRCAAWAFELNAAPGEPVERSDA